MATDTVVRARIAGDVKKEAAQVLGEMGTICVGCDSHAADPHSEGEGRAVRH